MSRAAEAAADAPRVRWLPSRQWRLDPELRRTLPQRGDDFERLCRVDGEPGGEQNGWVKRQQMRRIPRGAHLLLQVRTRVLNDELTDVFRRWYPRFDHTIDGRESAA